MKEITKRNNAEWAKCPVCGHKFFRLCDGAKAKVSKLGGIEIKCHSCKSIITLEVEHERA